MTQSSFDVPAVRRAVAVAREYDGLMGMTWVVVGAGFFMAALTGQSWVWIALGSALSSMCPQWYYRRFGYTSPRPGRLARTTVGAVVIFVAVLVASGLDDWLAPPVVLSLLVVAAGLGATQFFVLRQVGLTPAHWAVYAALVVAAFAPIAGVANNGLLTPFVLVTIGAGLVVIGLVDHRRLVAVMGPAANVDGRS